MANGKRGGVTDTVNLAASLKTNKMKLADGKEYELAPVTLNTIADMEERFGENYAEMLKKGSPKAVRYFLYLSLRNSLKASYPEITEELVGDLVLFDTAANQPSIADISHP